VNKVATWVAEEMARLGAEVERRPVPDGRYGDTVVGTWHGDPGAGPRLLLIGHMDTVFEDGTAADRPFRIESGIAYGPGVTDMKGGLLAGLYAIRAFRSVIGQEAPLPFERITYIANPDEEVGSPSSSPHIREAAAESDVCLCLECARANGDIVSARKGIVDLRITFQGRAAHAGVEPEKGISAVQELAHQVLALHALADREIGTTVNVGVVRGGTRPNVVAASAEAEIDVRVATLAEAARLDAAIRGLRPWLPGARLTVEGGLNRPPMERSAAMGRLFERARAIAAGMGVADLREGSTGGGSDGNFTAALGIPTLDGLGPEGEGAHAAHEHVLVESLPRRAALVAGLLAET
jgi:glutamate carboxypeptidase